MNMIIIIFKIMMIFNVTIVYALFYLGIIYAFNIKLERLNFFSYVQLTMT